MNDCKHLKFLVHTRCGRIIEESEAHLPPERVKPVTVQVDLKITCEACGAPLRFLGLPRGVNHHGAATSIDGLEARLGTVVEERALWRKP